MNKGDLFLHNHPMLEKSLGIDIKHVIIDRDAWNFVRAQNRNVDMPIYASIDAELKRAEKKHPNYPNNMFEQLAIMNEEAGEVTKAVLHYHYEGGRLEDIREELIQTAAMCVRMLKNPSIYYSRISFK